MVGWILPRVAKGSDAWTHSNDIPLRIYAMLLLCIYHEQGTVLGVAIVMSKTVGGITPLK